MRREGSDVKMRLMTITMMKMTMRLMMKRRVRTYEIRDERKTLRNTRRTADVTRYEMNRRRYEIREEQQRHTKYESKEISENRRRVCCPDAENPSRSASAPKDKDNKGDTHLGRPELP